MMGACKAAIVDKIRFNKIKGKGSIGFCKK
jgi:hypothetical protein